MSRLALNERPLTKARTASLIGERAVYREDLSARAVMGSHRPRLYAHPDGCVLWVDCGNGSHPNRGDLFTAETAEHIIESSERATFLFSRDGARFRHASGARVWESSEALLANLSDRIGAALDVRYKTLDLVSEWAIERGLAHAMREAYAHIWALVGETYRARSGGAWTRDGSDDYYGPTVLGDEGQRLVPELVVSEAFISVRPRFALRSRATHHAREAARTNNRIRAHERARRERPEDYPS